MHNSVHNSRWKSWEEQMKKEKEWVTINDWGLSGEQGICCDEMTQHNHLKERITYWSVTTDSVNLFCYGAALFTDFLSRLSISKF